MGIEELIIQLAEERGEKRGERKAKYLFVKKLLADTDFSIRKIASTVDVSENFVRKIEAEQMKERMFVTNLLTQTDCKVSKIASLVGVPVSFVKKVKKDISFGMILSA